MYFDIVLMLNYYNEITEWNGNIELQIVFF